MRHRHGAGHAVEVRELARAELLHVAEIDRGVAQLAYLHVTLPLRSTGIGRRIADELEQIARHAGASTMVVSATPSGSFYMGRGFRPTDEPRPEPAARSSRTSRDRRIRPGMMSPCHGPEASSSADPRWSGSP
jgi:N-acetylglutamate synthase-like GNAT family acetyltransferase